MSKTSCKNTYIYNYTYLKYQLVIQNLTIVYNKVPCKGHWPPVTTYLTGGSVECWWETRLCAKFSSQGLPLISSLSLRIFLLMGLSFPLCKTGGNDVILEVVRIKQNLNCLARGQQSVCVSSLIIS